MPAKRTDPVIAEVHAIRDRYAARFGYDVAAIFRDLRARQKSSGRVYIEHLARRAAGNVEVDNTGPETNSRAHLPKPRN